MTSLRTVFNRSYGHRATGAKFKVHWGVLGMKCNSFGSSETQTSSTRNVSWNGLSSKAYTYTAPKRFYWIVPTSATLGVPTSNAQVSFKVSGQSKVTCVVVKVPATQSGGCAKKP